MGDSLGLPKISKRACCLATYAPELDEIGGVGIDHSQFKEDSISFGLFIYPSTQKTILSPATSELNVG